jgi:hypothetical protein
VATIQSNFLFNSHVRPAWAGPITISDNVPSTSVIDPLAHKNARSVKGIVVPVTTKGRKGAPVAFSGQKTGWAYGTDKGHMFGLEIGGPDISENISPQSSLWQQSGGWRNIEKEALAVALQWMGLNDVYDPGNIPQQPPAAGAFLTVAPYPEIDKATGEPLQYTGSIVRVVLTGGGGYYPDTRTNPGIILIRPNDPWRG